MLSTGDEEVGKKVVFKVVYHVCGSRDSLVQACLCGIRFRLAGPWQRMSADRRVSKVDNFQHSDSVVGPRVVCFRSVPALGIHST